MAGGGPGYYDNSQYLADLGDSADTKELRNALQTALLAVERSKLDIAKLENESAGKSATIKKLVADIGDLNAELAEAKRLIKELGEGTGLQDFKQMAERAVGEFDAWIKTMKLDLNTLYGDGRTPLANLEESVRTGQMTVNEAITQTKAEYADLIEVGESGGQTMAQSLATFSSALTNIMNIITQVLTKLEQFETNGVKTASSVGEASTEMQVMKESTESIGTVAESSGEAVKTMADAIHGLASGTDAQTLAYLSALFSSIGSVSKLSLGGTSIENLVTLVTQLKGISVGEPIKFNFDFSALKDLNIRKTSLANLATYLPQIASVDVSKLEALSKINFDNFAGLKVSKSSLSGVKEMAEAMETIQAGIAKAAGSGGGGPFDPNNPSNPGNPGNIDGLDKIVVRYDKAGKVIRRTTQETEALGQTLQRTFKINKDGTALEETGQIRTINNLKVRAAAEKQFAESAKESTTNAMTYLRAFYKERLQLEKGALKDSNLVDNGENGYGYVGGASEFSGRIATYNQLLQILQQLGFTYEQLTNSEKMMVSGGQEAEQMIGKLNISAKDYMRIVTLINDRKRQLTDTAAQNAANIERTWNKNAAKAHDYYERLRDIIAQNPEVARLGRELNELATNGSPKDLNLLTQKMGEFQHAVRASGADVEQWFQKIKKSFGSRLRSMVSGFAIGYVMRYVRQLYSNVKELDSALTQMQIVVGGTETAMNEFADSMAKSAQKVGASISDLVKSATTFARLGYNSAESGTFAELAAMYSKVADTDVNSATTAITTIVKAFGVNADELEGVLDKLMYVGKNFPISSEELGTGFQNAGSALQAAGNTIEQSIALLTAANTQVQDISRASTGLRTIAARMTASKTDLEELGEDIEDVLSTPKLQKFMRAYGVEITNAKGELRSTYDVMLDLSKVWDRLTTTQRASIAEKLAGTRQQAVFYGLINSMQSEAKGVMEVMSDANGALEQANAIRLDSIQGRIDQLTASFQEFSNVILNSDVLKGFFEGLNGLMQGFVELSGTSFGKVITDITVITVGLTALVTLFQKLNMIGTFNVLKKGAIALGNSFAALFSKQQRYVAETEASTGATNANTASLNKNTVSKKMSGVANDNAASAETNDAAALGVNSEATAKNTRVTIENNNAKKSQAAVTSAASKATSKAGAIIAIVVTALTILKTVLDAVDKSWQKEYEAARQSAEEHANTAEKLRDEVNTLEGLKEKLEEANGDRQTLAEIYKELGDKIQDVKGFLNGEAEAHIQVADAIAREIAQKNRLIEIEDEGARKDAEKKLRSNKVVLGDSWNDFLLPDMSAEELYEEYFSDPQKGFQKLFNSGGWLTRTSGWTDELRDAWEKYNYLPPDDVATVLLKQMLGGTDSAWTEFLTAQENNALEAYSYLIPKNGVFSESVWESIIKSFADRMYTTQIPEKMKEIEDSIAGVNEKVEEYDNLRANKPTSYEDRLQQEHDELALYEQIDSELNNLIELYPELEEQILAVKDSIAKPVKVTAVAVEEKEILDVLEDAQDGFDAIAAAIKDTSTEGTITAKSLQNLLKIEKDLSEAGFVLSDYLERTAEGYKLNTEALLAYIRVKMAAYNVDGPFDSVASIMSMIHNLETYKAVIETLIGTLYNDKSEEKSAKKALNARKDALKEQEKEYENLIKLRKKILETYKDELEYQKKLAKQQKDVASLQTRLSLAMLDSSASGRARARELRDQLEEAQSELDEFTLDHAVDQVKQDLDDQLEEYKKFIENELDDIEKKISNLDDKDDPYGKKQLYGLLQDLYNLISNYKEEAIKNADYSDRYVLMRRRNLESSSEATEDTITQHDLVVNDGGAAEQKRKTGELYSFLQDFIGEFGTKWSTPSVDNPSSVTAASTGTGSITSGTTIINAPLVNVEIGSVNDDNVDVVQDAADLAVSEIQNMFVGGFRRTGKRAVGAIG